MSKIKEFVWNGKEKIGAALQGDALEPGSVLKMLYGKVPVVSRAAFWGTVIVGLLTHIYQFTNKFFNYDELMNLPSGYGMGAELGRWMLRILGDICGNQFGNYSLPFVNGMISVFWIALSAALVASMFKMSGKLHGFLMGGLMISFPAVTSTYLFMYTATFYAFAIFLSVLAAYLTMRFGKSVICNLIAVVSIACSLGIYQAYFGNTASLLLIAVILMCAFSDDEYSWKEIFFTAVRYLVVMVLGLVLYLVLHKFFVAYWGIDVNNYQGVDSMGKTSVADLYVGIKNCYHYFLALFSSDVMCLNPTTYVRNSYFVQMAMWGVGAFALVFFEKTCKIKKAFMIFGYAILPVAFFLIFPMTPNGWVYTLMAYSAVFVSVFTLIWADRYHMSVDKNQIMRKVTQWVAVVTSVIMISVYVWYGNGCYLSLEYTKYHDMAYFQTMITQIKSLDGYDDEMPLALLGTTITDETNNMGSLVGQTFGLGGKIDSNISAYSRDMIITKLLGFAPRFCGYEEVKMLMEHDEVKAMPCYPDSGSVKIIDGIVVVKIMEQ